MENKLTNELSTEISASNDLVWKALTDPAMIKQYFFGTDTHTDWKKGSPIRFTGEWQGKTYEDKGTIEDIETGKLIQYKYWSSMSGMEDKPENYATITYKLAPGSEDGKTKVTIIQDNIPDEKMKAHAAENWKMVLNNLKELLEK